ncbi:TPA: hypothetical protein QDA90_003503 [Burkholderia vietnamiensis]|uniref:hypothetical protein n=1 Tax=Burkholderia vietnamiensis TaxID=60552 RepID=UPI00298B4D28|nr:hypothetical protein [Burkholderia vietnamiensis]
MALGLPDGRSPFIRLFFGNEPMSSSFFTLLRARADVVMHHRSNGPIHQYSKALALASGPTPMSDATQAISIPGRTQQCDRDAIVERSF